VRNSYSLTSSSPHCFRYYPSKSTCDKGTFFKAFWYPIKSGDYVHDDDARNVAAVHCEANTYSEQTKLDGGLIMVTYNAATYFSVSTDSSSGVAVAYSASLSPSCFAGCETIVMADGTVKAISEVALGDSILSSDSIGNVKFSNVIAVPHDRNNELAIFTKLSTASADIKMTADHLIMVDAGCNGVAKLTAASSVESGMCLVSVDGPVAVKSVKTVHGHGVYSVVTEEEFIVVNGFVASPFAVNHAVANAYYNVIRAVPALMHFDVVKQASALLGSLAQCARTLNLKFV
jgi:hypothetical protein